jgi:GNAT superfamily N-acetyltransferase
MNNIIYSVENSLDPMEFRDVLVLSTLGERRPIEDLERIGKMVRNANLIVTARSNKRLVGIARSVSDFAYCTYLSDLAVVKEFQHAGIGKELIRRTKLAAPEAMLILLSAPLAIDFYPKIGMTKHEAAFTLKEISNLR